MFRAASYSESIVIRNSVKRGFLGFRNRIVTQIVGRTLGRRSSQFNLEGGRIACLLEGHAKPPRRGRRVVFPRAAAILIARQALGLPSLQFKLADEAPALHSIREIPV